MKSLNILYTIVLSMVLFSCEEVPVVIPEMTTIQTGKTVLIEELTGVSCPNCPSGSAQLASLKQIYGDNVIPVSIHGEFLCTPLSSSAYDFRTEEGVELENYLALWFGKPSAAFNRSQQDGETEFAISKFDLWGTYVDNELSKDQQIELAVSTTFDSDSRDLTVDVGVIPIEDLSGDYRIGVMIVESHIIDPQLNQSDIISEYEHNHVLRDMLTPIDGQGLATNLVRNEAISRSFSYNIPAEDGWWIAENMEVVVFVALTTPETKEIIQATQAYVIE